jgi:hypothetical protein
LQLTVWSLVLRQSLLLRQFCSDGHAKPHELPLAAGPDQDGVL